MSDDDVLVQQVTDTLRAHAGRLIVEPRPFRPVHTALDLGPDGHDHLDLEPARRDGSFDRDDALGSVARFGDPPSRSARGRVLRVAAAVVAVAAAVTGVVVARSGDDDDLRLQAVAGVPEDALAPLWEGPDGWEMSGLDWTDDLVFVDGDVGTTMGTAATAQLFGEPDDPDRLARSLLLEIDTGSNTGEGPERTVRGQPGRWGPDDRDPDATTLVWREAGVVLRATYRGMSTAEAVGVLDALVVRAGGVEAGFDPPPGGLPSGLVALTEAHRPETPGPPTTVSSTFGPRAEEPAWLPGPLRHPVRVETVTPVGELTPDYVAAWFVAGRGRDRVVRWWTPPGSRPGGLLDSQGVLLTIDPDGRTVTVTLDVEAAAADGLGSGESVARDITDSVAPVAADQLTELWEGLVDRWAAAELVVAVPTPAGTVELRGRGPASALCLATGEARRCAAADHTGHDSDPGGLDGQWMATVPTDDGDQLVALSDRGPILIEVATSSADSDDPDGQDFSFPEAATGRADGSWAAVHLIPAGAPGRAQPVTNVAREAEACLDMLGSELNPGGGQPEVAERIRTEGGGPATMYQACRALTVGSWYQDVGP